MIHLYFGKNIWSLEIGVLIYIVGSRNLRSLGDLRLKCSISSGQSLLCRDLGSDSEAKLECNSFLCGQMSCRFFDTSTVAFVTVPSCLLTVSFGTTVPIISSKTVFFSNWPNF